MYTCVCIVCRCLILTFCTYLYLFVISLHFSVDVSFLLHHQLKVTTEPDLSTFVHTVCEIIVELCVCVCGGGGGVLGLDIHCITFSFPLHSQPSSLSPYPSPSPPPLPSSVCLTGNGLVFRQWISQSPHSPTIHRSLHSFPSLRQTRSCSLGVFPPRTPPSPNP